MRVVIAGGGTAGHVNPAIALARALGDDRSSTANRRSEKPGITFIGTPTGVEATLVPAAGFSLQSVRVRGFDRARPLSIVATGGRALKAVADARRILTAVSPTVVVGMGGYVSLPVCLAARSLRVPMVLHEQNIVLGLANRVAAPFARAVGVSFEETRAAVGRRAVLTGNPVMPEMASFDRTTERERGIERFSLDPARRTVLVFGGSLGAQRVNEAASGLATRWRERADVQVLHIAGRAAFPRLRADVGDVEDGEAPKGRLIYRVVEYVDRMLEAYCVADVALCRGGATTVAELTCVGLPSIIVPYPYHRDRQQERHAEVLERAGAAEVVADKEATTETIGGRIEGLLTDDGRRERMEQATAALGRPDAAFRLADIVLRIGS